MKLGWLNSEFSLLFAVRNSLPFHILNNQEYISLIVKCKQGLIFFILSLFT